MECAIVPGLLVAWILFWAGALAGLRGGMISILFCICLGMWTYVGYTYSVFSSAHVANWEILTGLPSGVIYLLWGTTSLSILTAGYSTGKFIANPTRSPDEAAAKWSFSKKFIVGAIAGALLKWILREKNDDSSDSDT